MDSVKYLLAFLFVLMATSSFAKEKSISSKAPMKEMNKNVDKIDGYEWYQDKKFKMLDFEDAVIKQAKSMGLGKYDLNEGQISYALNKYSSGVQIYIGRKITGGKPWLRMKIVYAGDSWIFVNSYKIVCDGKPYELAAKKVVRNTTKGGVTETIDFMLEDSQMDWIKQIPTAKEVVVRFYGENKNIDHDVSRNEKDAIARVLNAFEFLRKE